MLYRNDILYRFWKTGLYEKQPAANGNTDEAHVHKDGCKETLSPAMDILVSSNFERLMWYLAEGAALACFRLHHTLVLILPRLRLDHWDG